MQTIRPLPRIFSIRANFSPHSPFTFDRNPSSSGLKQSVPCPTSISAEQEPWCGVRAGHPALPCHCEVGPEVAPITSSSCPASSHSSSPAAPRALPPGHCTCSSCFHTSPFQKGLSSPHLLTSLTPHLPSSKTRYFLLGNYPKP